MSWIFSFVKDTLSDSSDFVRSIIGYSTEQRTRNPEILRNEVRRREEEEVKRQEEMRRIKIEERRQRAKIFADAAERRIERRRANDALLEALRNDRQFQRGQ